MQRLTSQRQIIQEVFKKSERPLTTGEIHERATVILHSIGIRTVYRFVNELISIGTVEELPFEFDGRRFQLKSKSKYSNISYFLCKKCKKVYWFRQSETLDNPEEAVSSDVHQVHGGCLLVWGDCLYCVEARKNKIAFIDTALSKKDPQIFDYEI